MDSVCRPLAPQHASTCKRFIGSAFVLRGLRGHDTVIFFLFAVETGLLSDAMPALFVDIGSDRVEALDGRKRTDRKGRVDWSGARVRGRNRSSGWRTVVYGKPTAPVSGTGSDR